MMKTFTVKNVRLSDLSPEACKMLASELGVSEESVVSVRQASGGVDNRTFVNVSQKQIEDILALHITKMFKDEFRVREISWKVTEPNCDHGSYVPATAQCRAVLIPADKKVV